MCIHAFVLFMMLFSLPAWSLICHKGVRMESFTNNICISLVIDYQHFGNVNVFLPN